MRQFLIKFFETREEPFDISLFSAWHFLYMAIIIASVIIVAICLMEKDEGRKMKVLNFYACAIVVIYIADFFIQPLFLDGEMNVDKLPFHICTLLCPVVALSHFNEKFGFLREPAVLLGAMCSFAYIIYPGSTIGTESPFCYEVIQTFVYHGLLFSYCVLMLTTGKLIPDIKKCYKSLIFVCATVVWAAFGNLVYSEGGWGDGYDWFFITGSTFDFIPRVLMPFVVVFCTFGMVIVLYGIYYLVRYIVRSKKRDTEAERDLAHTQI